MDFDHALTLIDERSAALRDAVAAAADFGARVPGCPDWDLRDLVAHLGAVQRFWAVVVRAADPTGPPSRSALGDREPSGDLLAWSAESTSLLLAALRASSAGTRAWAWWGASSAPLTVGAIARHQVQEAAVHAYDAQEARGQAGVPEPLPVAVAADGVAEFLQVGVGSLGAWPHQPARVRFDASDGQPHTLDLTPSGGRLLEQAAAGEPTTVIRGTSSDLVLVLYGRLPLEALAIDGDREVLTRLRAWSNPD
ncbi:maleylpyruvate isomerase family mycothiol-dependent enzyme [Paractinoplanes lichenicola]|uniref:Maleylpyruvate isomerase family mycothiol-dependent enzyme n=1 Tax=Paractinoplanes lichenicola TaxID=2802976 RepID=A0ABS1VPQ8_9ACTN|nr:maleylpyruvate isomerase family mycothiol-dependent enzyme [Actinoplanes lichenicola]MBL7256712.1 maleylpyruvate isomerase family mycothiol-dependent enzyme [Actinoplanes lichenicola]